MKAGLILLILLLMLGCSNNPSKEQIFTITHGELEQLKLAYYSDYYSFIGWDEKGMVAFAIDTNRGRDGDTWQADHFVVLYDESQGWVDIQGNGFYDNSSRALESVPPSPFFTYSSSGGATTIKSEPNGLKLDVGITNKAIDNRVGISHYTMGSAPAQLSWNGRTLKGRAIHEYLFLPAFNRLSRKYLGLFKDFHGIYAVIDKKHDFYFHIQESDFLAELTGGQEGFINLEQAQVLRHVTVQPSKRQLTWGFYRWPTTWTGKIDINSKTATLNLKNTRRKPIANWIIGGFSMGIAKGQLIIDEKHYDVIGLSELIL